MKDVHVSDSQAVFLPVPGWPGYSVSEAGEVRSRWSTLEVNSRGRVTLRHADTKKTKTFTPQELFALAASATEKSAMPAPEAAAAPKSSLASMADVAALRSDLGQALDEVDRLKERLADQAKRAKEALDKARYQKGLNATLWHRLRRLEADLAAPVMSAGAKKKRVEAEIEDWSELEDAGFGRVSEASA